MIKNSPNFVDIFVRVEQKNEIPMRSNIFYARDLNYVIKSNPTSNSDFFEHASQTSTTPPLIRAHTVILQRCYYIRQNEDTDTYRIFRRRNHFGDEMQI